jgi:MFS family permease
MSESVVPTAIMAPPATPLKRLAVAMITSNVGMFIGLLTPLQLLLTLQVTRIAGTEAAGAFGIITGVGALCAMVANPLGGRLSDRTVARFGRRRTWMLTGAIGGALAVFALAFTDQVWQVALIWCAAQTLFNFQEAANSALLADQVPPAKRGSVSGFLGLGIAIGPLAGVAAVSWIHDHVVQWIVVAVLSLALSVVAVMLVRDPRHVRPEGEARISVTEMLRSFWLNPWKHPAFGWTWIVRFLLTCAHASSTYNAFLLIDRFGVSPERVGGSVLVLALISILLLAATSVIAGAVSDRVGRQKPFMVVAGVLAVASLVVMALAPSMAFVFVAAALLGIGTGFFFAVSGAVAVRVLPSAENAGKDLAVMNIGNTLPQSLVPFAAPALLALGGFPLFYGVLAVLAALGTLAVARIPEIGREGDARWAPITRAARTAERVGSAS